MTQAKNKPVLFNLLLIFFTIAVVIYTAFAVKNEGWSLFEVIKANITALNWNGQFNLDFSCYLTLSGIWIMWRNKFSAQSVFLSIAAMVIGIMFFAPYLLYLLSKENGDIKGMLTGA